MTTTDEDRLRTLLHEAYPPPPDDPALVATVLMPRDPGARPIRTRGALAVLAAAVAVTLIVGSLAARDFSPGSAPSPPPTRSAIESTPGLTEPTPTTPPSQQVSPVSELVDRTWRIPGSGASFYLSGSRLIVSPQCGDMTATAVVVGDELRVSRVGSSFPSCPAVLVGVADDLLQANTLTWHITGDRLVLTAPAGRQWTYVDVGAGHVSVPDIPANSAGDIAALAGTTWSLPGTNAQVTFAGDRLMVGGLGCNQLNGFVDITDDQIQVANPDTLYCPDGSSPGPFHFQDQPLRWHLDGDLLLLTDRSGNAVQLVETAKDEPTDVDKSVVDHSWQIPGSDLTVYFTSDSVTVETGCRQLVVSAAFSGTTVAGTGKWSNDVDSCATVAVRPDLAGAFTSGQTMRWAVSSNRLTLTAPDGRMLTFLDAGKVRGGRVSLAVMTAANADSLRSSSWHLPGTTATLRFAGGKINLQMGTCNQVRADFTVSITTISVNHQQPTPQCVDSSGSIFPALPPFRWYLDGDLLLLSNAQGAAVQWVRTG